MSAKRCWECNTTFYSDYGAIYCNVCHQARQTRQANERQARQDQWQAEQNARIQAQHTQALINAENQRIAAINRQTRVIAESVIKPKDAYDRGYKYPDNEFRYSNPAELEIEVNERGELLWRWNHLYIIDELNNQFRQGLGARLNQHKNMYNTIKDSAKQAGRQNADGSLPPRFTLYTGLSIGGKAVNTKAFNSRFTSRIDEKTGELKMNWHEPFESAELNQAYKDGASEVYQAENTEEKKNYRLKFEVPKIKAAREQTRFIRLLNTVFKISRYGLPLLALYLVWQLLTGFTFLFSLVGVFVFYVGLEHLHEQWQIKNNDHLR